MALHAMGLSTQVPGRAVYLSDGPTRRYALGSGSLEFRHTKLKEAGLKSWESGMVVQALRALGEERIDGAVIGKIREWLPEGKRAKVRKETQRVTGWVFAAIVKITEPDESDRGAIRG